MNQENIKDILISIESSLKESNYFAAISSSLILIDICASIEYEKLRNKERYQNWTDKYLVSVLDRNEYLNKENIYYLRCSFLHQGSANPTTQPAYGKNTFNKIYDLVPVINYVNEEKVIVADVDYPDSSDNSPTVFIEVRYLCEAIMKAVSNWLIYKKENKIFNEKDLNIFSIGVVGVRKDSPNKMIIMRRQ